MPVLAALAVMMWGVVSALLWRLYRRSTLYRDALALGLLTLLTVGFFWPLFFAKSWIPKGGGDLASFIYPTYVFAARWIRRGVIPLWNPHLYLGMPFAADNQSGLFYPLNLLIFLLLPRLTYRAVELMAVAHVWLAGVFTYAFLRDLPGVRDPSSPMGRLPALLGATAYMFSDLFVIHPGNLNIIATAAWLPLAMLCFRRAMNECGWGWTAWSGIVLGIAALAGHAQMFLYLIICIVLYAVFAIYLHRSDGMRAGLTRVARLVLSGTIAFGVAALSLVPAYDLTHYTVRATLSYQHSTAFALPPAGLIGLLVPAFWGRAAGPFWGPWARTDTGYVGILPLILAAVAIPLTWRRRPTTRFWFLPGAFGLFTALGGYTLLHGWTYALIPPFRQLRVPARALFLFDFAVAILAATGFDALTRPLNRRARRSLDTLGRTLTWIGGALTLGGIPLLAHATLVTRASAPDLLSQCSESLGGLIFFALLFWMGIGWLSLRRHRMARPLVWRWLGIALVAFDLISLGAYVETEPNDPLVGYRHDREVAFLRADPEVFRVETAPEVQGGWAPDWALIYEMDDFSGIWNPLRLGAYDVLTWVGIGRGDPFYNLYNVKYLLANDNTVVPEHFEAVFREGKRVIYRNPRALPRAFMVYRSRVVGGQIKALQTARAPDFDPAAEVVLEKPEGRALSGEEVTGEEQVEIVDRGPNHLTLHVITPAEGYLFVSEMWMPGWVAYVNGERKAVLRANYTFRAVHLPPGEHMVHMSYRPRSWLIGLGLTATTWIALLTWGTVILWLRKKEGQR